MLLNLSLISYVLFSLKINVKVSFSKWYKKGSKTCTDIAVSFLVFIFSMSLVIIVTCLSPVTPQFIDFTYIFSPRLETSSLHFTESSDAGKQLPSNIKSKAIIDIFFTIILVLFIFNLFQHLNSWTSRIFPFSKGKCPKGKGLK